MPLTPIMNWNPAGRLDPLYDPEDATELPVNLVGATPAVLYERGTVLGELAATPGLYGAYDPNAGDGRQVAKMILRYRTSALGSGAAAADLTWIYGEWGLTKKSTTAFKSGDFDLKQLVGMTSAALGNLAARLVQGSLGAAEVDSIVVTATGGTWGLTIPAVLPNPAVVIANTALAYNISAAALQASINAALASAGIASTVTVTGGPGATAPLVVTFFGALGQSPLVVTTDATLLTGGANTAVLTRTTQGRVPAGVVRLG